MFPPPKFFLLFLLFLILCFTPPTLLASQSSCTSQKLHHLHLHPIDYNALLQIHKHFHIPPPPPAHLRLCNSAAAYGVFCQPRLAPPPHNNNTCYVLRVTRLLFQSQHLKGTLSPFIGNLSELQQLSLPHNHVINQIPSQITRCHKLEILHLNNNRFSGNIPTGFSGLARLRVLDLSSNYFTGDLQFLQSLQNLVKLNLAHNMFEGQLPASLASFPNLRFINVSHNSLMIHNLDLPTARDVNNRMPNRYVYIESSQGGNKSTSAVPPSSSSSEEATAGAPSPATVSKHKHKSNKKKATEWILRFLSGILAGGVSGLVFVFLFKMIMHLVRKRKRDTRLKIFSPMIKRPEDLAFLDKEEGLASLEVIGRGGCGEVYKTALPGSNSIEIAIKKIIQLPMNAGELTEEDSKLLHRKMRQIRSEIQTVGQIRHRNLLPLLAHLPRPNCHYLVYEYMKNGSLHDYLKHVADGKRELHWLARHKIAVGIAAGLEHLHMNHNPRIIHRDLKPGNILLDDEMDARIADFGLATAVPDANTHVTTSIVAGTVGYIAPEYYQTFKFTDKCDIYSFGVVLGVLVVGKMPSDEFFQQTDEVSMVQWMRNLMISEDPRRAIDPKLRGKGYEDQMLLVLKVACFCTLDNPIERPNSRDVGCMLSQIKH